jgi:prophage regulatory protein
MSERIIRYSELCGRLSIARVTAWRMVRDGLLPRPHKITKRIVGWTESEIEAWIEARARRPAGE